MSFFSGLEINSAGHQHSRTEVAYPCCRERVQDSVRVAYASIQRGVSHSGGLQAGSGNGTRSSYSLEEGGHRGGPSSRQRVWVLQPILHCSEEGWGVASNSRSEIVEPIVIVERLSWLRFKKLTIKQVMSQIRSKDWFVTIDMKDAYFHISILPQHRKLLRFAFGGKAYQYQVLTFG